MVTNYHNAKIYKVTCLTTSRKYISWTCQSLVDQLEDHEIDWSENKGHPSQRVLQHDNYIIELILSYACANKQSIINKTNEYIQSNASYYAKNKTSIKAKAKQYYLDNRLKIIERNEMRQRMENEKREMELPTICDCGAIYKTDRCSHMRTKKHQMYIAQV